MEKGGVKSNTIYYGRNELIDVLENALGSHRNIKDIPAIMNALINGNHERFIKEILDNVFAGNSNGFLGMRYSVYCTGQILFANKEMAKKQDSLLPWLAEYPFNNVNHRICKCWIKDAALSRRNNAADKSPVYSNKPALLGAGDVDPWTRPFYNDLIHHYMPNSQRVLVVNHTHLPPLGTSKTDFIKAFLDNPYQKLSSDEKGVIVY